MMNSISNVNKIIEYKFISFYKGGQRSIVFNIQLRDQKSFYKSAFWSFFMLKTFKQLSNLP